MMFFHVLGQTEELVKALQDLENAASGDATVRQKIASLPQEVQDVSLLEKITGQAQEPPREQKQTRPGAVILCSDPHAHQKTEWETK